jgi:hypothetical protein
MCFGTLCVARALVPREHISYIGTTPLMTGNAALAGTVADVRLRHNPV